MDRWMDSCDKVTLWVSRSLDQKLPLPQRLRIWVHLRMCCYCMRFKQQLLHLRKSVRQAESGVGEDPASPGLSPEGRERIKCALRAGKKDISL